MKKYEEKFIENLTQLLEEKKMSGKDLAESIGMSPVTIYRFLNSHSYPDLDAIIKIGDYFHVSIDWMIGRSL